MFTNVTAKTVPTVAELQDVVGVVLQQQQVELAAQRVDLPLPLLRHHQACALKEDNGSS